MRRGLLLGLLLGCWPAVPGDGDAAVRNLVVYREPGRFGGWPANHGIWSWGDQILVGFEAGYFKYSDTRHSIDWDRPAEHLLARSLDGGETWSIEHPEGLKPPDGAKIAGVPTEPGGKQPVDCPGDITAVQISQANLLVYTKAFAVGERLSP